MSHVVNGKRIQTIISFREIQHVWGDPFSCPECGTKEFYQGPSGCGDYNIRCSNFHYLTTRFPMGIELDDDHSYPGMFKGPTTLRRIMF